MILAGMAVGGPIGGLIVDQYGPRAGYLTVALACLLPVLIALAGALDLRRNRD